MRINQLFNKYWYYFRSIFELLSGIVEWILVIRIFLHWTGLEEKQVRLRKPRLMFTVRGSMDIWSIKETLIDRFYERHGCPIGEGWVIVDIGAGIGDFTSAAAYRDPQNRVYAFEPYYDSYLLLCRNIQENGLANITAHQEAVWSETGALALDLSGGEPLQFRSLDAAEAAALQCEHCLVPCTSLEDMLKRLELEGIDLLKMDCEGAEYRILMHTPQDSLRRVRRIVMEYHDNTGSSTHRDLEHFLTKSGYMVRSVQNVVHPYLGYLYADRK